MGRKLAISHDTIRTKSAFGHIGSRALGTACRQLAKADAASAVHPLANPRKLARRPLCPTGVQKSISQINNLGRPDAADAILCLLS
jgi:hypothetical protein